MSPLGSNTSSLMKKVRPQNCLFPKIFAIGSLFILRDINFSREDLVSSGTFSFVFSANWDFGIPKACATNIRASLAALSISEIDNFSVTSLSNCLTFNRLSQLIFQLGHIRSRQKPFQLNLLVLLDQAYTKLNLFDGQ